MTDTSPNLALPYIMPAQAQKHVTHNEGVRMLDALVQLSVADRDLAAPPASPLDGARYIVAAAATGLWAGHSGHVAAWQDGAWAFLAPREGWLAWIADEDRICAYDGTAWVLAAGGGATSVNPTPLVGVNATADTTNRLSVASPASLLNHEGGGHQLKINKASAANTASLLFQDAFSGRAEVGLAGDDNLHLKVSADGATWRDALVVDRTSGAVSMPFTTFSSGGGGSPSIADGRLTLVTAKPVMDTSVTAATVLIYTQATGSVIALYDGSVWQFVTFAETSLPLAGTAAATLYDVYGYLASSALALELTAWSGSGAGGSTRATQLARQNGVLVKAGAPTRRYLGTIFVETAGQCQWVLGSAAAGGGAAKLDVWNCANRVNVSTMVSDTTAFWDITTAAWQPANSSNGNRVSFVQGLAEDGIAAAFAINASAIVAGSNPLCSIGFNATGAKAAEATNGSMNGSNILNIAATFARANAIGRNYLQAIERLQAAAGTYRYYGDVVAGGYRMGLSAQLRM